MEELKKLKEVIGLRAYMALRRGAPLRVWRRSSPWNWWVENRKGKMLWHSDRGRPRPSLDMFEQAVNRGSVIDFNFCHSDGGKYESSFFFLKKEFRV